jgi:predicted Zn-dependent protease
MVHKPLLPRRAQLDQRLMQLVVAVVIGALAIGVFALRGCQRGPFGRRQVVALNPGQEAALGAQAYREALKKAKVIETGPLVEQVEEVTNRLINATRNRDFLRLTKIDPDRFASFEWQVKVVQSKEVNAFCLPGGKMVVYTGILPVCRTDAGLATVMGHEIAHALSSHGAERMAQEQMTQIGLMAAGAGMGDMDYRQRQAIMQVLNAGAQFGILKYSREHESEADHVGLLLMACAGYDPRQAVTFWERMRAATGGKGGPPEFMSTHPSHDRRIRELEGWMPEALALYKATGRSERPVPLMSR